MIDLDKVPRVALASLHQDHLDVAALLNQLRSTLARADDAAALTQQFSSLIEHCENHFHCEEHQMRKYNYPPRDAHQAEHNRVLEEMKVAQTAWQTRHDTRRLENYLSATFIPWLLNHIETEDILAARFMVEAGGS